MKGNKATLSATHLKSVCLILFARLSSFDYPEAVLKHRLQIKPIFFNINSQQKKKCKYSCSQLYKSSLQGPVLFVKHGASLWKGILAHFMIMLVKQILARGIGIQKDNCG